MRWEAAFVTFQEADELVDGGRADPRMVVEYSAVTTVGRAVIECDEFDSFGGSRRSDPLGDRREIKQPDYSVGFVAPSPNRKLCLSRFALQQQWRQHRLSSALLVLIEEIPREPKLADLLVQP